MTCSPKPDLLRECLTGHGPARELGAERVLVQVPGVWVVLWTRSAGLSQSTRWWWEQRALAIKGARYDG